MREIRDTFIFLVVGAFLMKVTSIYTPSQEVQTIIVFLAPFILLLTPVVCAIRDTVMEDKEAEKESTTVTNNYYYIEGRTRRRDLNVIDVDYLEMK